MIPEPKNGIRLSEVLQREVEELARRTGEAPLALIARALQLLKATLRPRDGGQVGAANSVYERWKKAGWIGCIEGGLPSDLSTNPRHMEGFGRD